MYKVMKVVRTILFFIVAIQVLCLEFLIKVIWGIIFFIISPVIGRIFPDWSVESLKDYGYKFKDDHDYYPILKFVVELWEDYID